MYYARIHFRIPTSTNQLHLKYEAGRLTTRGCIPRNRMAQMVALPISNQKVLGINLGPDTYYHDGCSPWRTSVTPEKFKHTQVRL